MKTRNNVVRRSAGRVAAGPCGENCNCPGDPGCPDFGATRSVSLGDVTKSKFLMNRYHRRGALGNADDEVFQMCVAGGGSASSCGDGKDVSASVYGAALSSPSTPGAAPGGSSSGSGAGGILSNVGAGLAAVFGQRPAMPMYPYPYNTGGISTTTMLLVGGAAVGLVLLLRR